MGMFGTINLIATLVSGAFLFRSDYPVPSYIFVALCAIGSYLGVSLLSPLLQKWSGVPGSLGVFIRVNLSSLLNFLILYWAAAWCCVKASEYAGPFAGVVATFLVIFVLSRIGLQLGIMWACGVIKKATPRLAKIAAEAVAESNLNIKPRVLTLDTSQANAFAFPGLAIVGVTTQALTLLNDLELKGILHHEFGHLTESRLQRSSRFLPILVYCLSLGALPTLIKIWPIWVVGLAFFAMIFGIKLLSSRISQRLEDRADLHARTASGEEEVIDARALEKLYKSNVAPAVFRSKMVTHPNLYDRMLKAGVQPDYERPRPPGRWFSVLGGSVIIVMLFVFTVVLQLMHSKSDKPRYCEGGFSSTADMGDESINQSYGYIEEDDYYWDESINQTY